MPKSKKRSPERGERTVGARLWWLAVLAGMVIAACTGSATSRTTSTSDAITPDGTDTTTTSSTPASDPTEEQVPTSRRDELDLHAIPLELPFLDPEEDCPLTQAGDALPGVVAQTYGEGPVYATLGTWDGTISVDEGDVLEHDGWYIAKVLWSVERTYEGPVLVRGRQLDGGGALLFTPEEARPSGHQLVELAIPSGTAPSGQAARFRPSGVMFRELGCYGLQVDGLGFQYVIVFLTVR